MLLSDEVAAERPRGYAANHDKMLRTQAAELLNMIKAQPSRCILLTCRGDGWRRW